MLTLWCGCTSMNSGGTMDTASFMCQARFEGYQGSGRGGCTSSPSSCRKRREKQKTKVGRSETE